MEEQFDNIAYRVKKENDSGEEAMEQYEPSVSVPEKMPISSFSTSLLPLLRSDFICGYQRCLPVHYRSSHDFGERLYYCLWYPAV